MGRRTTLPPPRFSTPRPEPVSPMLLRLSPPGFVVMTVVGQTFWRKSNDDTWYPIDPETMQRRGSRNRIATKMLQAVLGPVETNPRTESMSSTN